MRLDTGADIAALPELDPKLWLTLSCPTKGLELDSHTLEILDGNGDGRVRVADVIEAVRWTTGLLKDPEVLVKRLSALPLVAIDDSKEEGKEILASARQILANLGKSGADVIAASDTRDTLKIFGATLFNGDGVVPPESAEDDATTRDAIRDILATVGAQKDLSGRDGVGLAEVERFYSEVGTYLAWSRESDAPSVSPLGGGTHDALDAFEAVAARVEDYFMRTALAAFDARAAGLLNPSDGEYAELAAVQLSESCKALEAMPIARIEAGAVLPLVEGLNPAWAERVRTFATRVVTPLLGERKTLDAEGWLSVKTRLAPHRAWRDRKPAGSVEKLGRERLEALDRQEVRAAIEALIAKDKSLEMASKAISAVDKLVHLHRDLHTFLNNFVCFRDFYSKSAKAVFQTGTLFLDGRSCDLVLPVEDAARHAALASRSMTYLVYCDCTRRGGAEKLAIVAAFTNGDSDFLMVGRNGVFYDRKGQDWDATITKVVEQPISMREAFFAPYRRVARFIGDQVESFAAAKDKASAEKLSKGVELPADAAPAAPAYDVGRFAGIFAAIGLAIGAIGTAVAAVVTGFLGLKWWQMPIALIGVSLVISGPSMLLTAAKLRRRSLAPILDANGWAINGPARISIPFGGSLTHLASLPPGSERTLMEPSSGSSRGWLVALVIALVVAVLAWLVVSGTYLSLIHR